ncbi:putative PRE10-20S proteasome subunit C1 [Tilletiaria anomala UBC 951]|uniref:Proteasome subunit alpha type n=1 Tax=Tilletiaria anomala (strain ATCC 24038 / CBS 436.72 / UBC 951) TaxID=1037660 RepID=A0A066VHW0_TILAU|nr:putative PRE10-20S proteasome subunit C1 [Tilletiaria anomala UBC 951]KDN38324.1 putative PRE10-20S proteasome subunit C1 [Tilletiaria anomala UBC 951]
MASQGTGYDLSASTYSPDGRIFQVEYANKAVENAGTAIGLKCKDGVVLAVEKLVTSKLLVPGSNRRIFNVDLHAGLVSAGLIADGKHMANRAREEAQAFRDTYRYASPIKALASRLSLYASAYTLYSSVRPFGISTIIGGIDQDTNEPQLFMIDPSGVFWGYHGCAIGKGKQLAKTEIEKLDLPNLTVNDAVQKAADIIYKVHDDAKDKDFELEISWIGPESGGKHQMVPADIIAEAGRKAKEALDDDMED